MISKLECHLQILQEDFIEDAPEIGLSSTGLLYFVPTWGYDMDFVCADLEIGLASPGLV